MVKKWEELHDLFTKKGILVEVAHVKVHCTKKEKEQMTQFERFVTKGNEKADELARAGAMLDEGFMAEVRADTRKQGREEVYVALQYPASFYCRVEQWKDCEELKPKPKEKWSFVDKRCEGMKHRTECRQGEVLIWCRKCSGYAKRRMGPKLMNCCNGEKNPNTRGRESPSQRSKELDNRGRKEKNFEKGVSEAVKQI